MIVYLNGDFLPQEEAKISPMDRGFLFGDGIYEAIPFYQGKPFSLDGHWKRLQDGLKFLQIDFRMSQEAMLKVFDTLFAKNQLSDKPRATIYLQITRGAPPTRAHAFPATTTTTVVPPTIFVSCQETAYPSPERWDQGLSAALVPDQRWARVDIKTVNLLANVLAAQQAKAMGADEAILVQNNNTAPAEPIITEGAKTNVFAVLKNGTVVTHPLCRQILPGITRNMVVEEAKKGGFVVEERPITKRELEQDAVEVFITSTTSEIKPITKIDENTIGSGRAGETTRKLLALLRMRIQKETGIAVE